MHNHFGVVIRDSKFGLNISKENYAIINNKSSFKSGKIYSDEWCKEHLKRCLTNYDLNMKFFSTLDRKEFDSELNKFVEKNHFEEVFDLSKYDYESGYYILILDGFCQIYIGTTNNIKKRIMNHWSRRKPFDRLIFGNVNNSILSIDSFRAFDTTRIFVYKTYKTFVIEDNYIDDFPPKFVLNRTIGGKLENGLMDAIINGKTKDLTKVKTSTN